MVTSVSAHLVTRIISFICAAVFESILMCHIKTCMCTATSAKAAAPPAAACAAGWHRPNNNGQGSARLARDVASSRGFLEQPRRVFTLTLDTLYFRRFDIINALFE